MVWKNLFVLRRIQYPVVFKTFQRKDRDLPWKRPGYYAGYDVARPSQKKAIGI
jgi:hypothetical protein